MQENKIFLTDFHIPRWNELPNVDLYMDQVVNLINSTLSPYIYFNNDLKKESNQLLTKTMINNYVKNNLIEAPEKKLYSKIQLAKLFAICVLKQVYSMQEIANLMSISLSKRSIQEAYDNFCNLFEEALICTYKKTNLNSDLENTDDFYLLKTVLLSCSYKIYVQNINF